VYISHYIGSRNETIELEYGTT